MVGTMEEERFARLNHRDSETSLDPTHFRMYASGQGRWLTPDPAGRWSASPLDPQSWNRYGYTLGNPVNHVDPFGLQCEGQSFWRPCNWSTAQIYSGTPWFNANLEQTLANFNNGLQAIGTALYNGYKYGIAGGQVLLGAGLIIATDPCGPFCLTTGALEVGEGLTTLTGNNNAAAVVGIASSAAGMAGSAIEGDWIDAGFDYFNLIRQVDAFLGSGTSDNMELGY
jgi:RHS repeat-associated protein